MRAHVLYYTSNTFATPTKLVKAKVKVVDEHM